MNRASLRAMTQTLMVQVPRQNEDAARALLMKAAEAEKVRVIREQTARSGVAPTLEVVVDGKRGAPFASVAADGMILLEWGYVREVAFAALQALRKAGPRESGDWGRTLTILSDGIQVNAAAYIPHLAREVHVVATQPYARRLEIGKTKRGDPFVLDDEDYKLVERTALRLRSVYRQVAKVAFAYVDLNDAWQLTNRAARAGKGGGQVRYPAVQITGWQVQ